MPRELPRREIEHQTEAKDLFEKKEGEIKTRGFQNSTRWSGAIGKPLPHGHPDLSKFSAQFQGTVAGLKKIANRRVIGSHRDAEWKPRTEKARGDLPGLWNDVKLDLASRAGTSADPQTAKRLNTALDLLELAEQRGGLGTRLEEWNELVSSRNYSWDLLAETAGQIQQGIEFCEQVAKESFGDTYGRGMEVEMIFALDAIASEITREADEILSSSRGLVLDPGKPFDAVVERFKDVSPRTGITGRLHDAFEGGTVAQNWVGELPEPMQKASATKDLSQALETWQAAAKEGRDVILYTDAHQAEDEQEAAENLDNAAEAIVKSIKSLTNYAPGTSPDQISMALHVYQRMGEEILAQHRDLSKHVCYSPEARKTLRGGVYFNELINTVANLEAAEPGKSVYSSARFNQGKLDVFWRQGKDSVDKGLRSAGHSALADEFAKTVGQGLENLLASWNKRDNQTSYRLAWEVTANLRDLKRRSEGLLKGAPAQRDYVRSALDAIADCIAVDLQEAS
jgi:predicted RNase H-like HicB family nuclease